MQAFRRLVEYTWPGNVRELHNEIDRLAHLCPVGRSIVSGMLSRHISNPESGYEGTAAAAGSRLPTIRRQELETQAIDEALRQTEGKKVEAAKLLGISREALRRRLQAKGRAHRRRRLLAAGVVDAAIEVASATSCTVVVSENRASR